MREEADAAPRRADRAGEEGAHAEGAFGEGVEFVAGGSEEAFVVGEGEEGEDDG